MTGHPLGKLREANSYLDDFGCLTTLFEQEGYLFFRGVLDRNEVDRVKRDFVSGTTSARDCGRGRDRSLSGREKGLRICGTMTCMRWNRTRRV